MTTTPPFDWAGYLALARWLQTNTPPGVSQEAAWRAAVGRAYYAAFGHARKYASAYLGFTPRNDAEDHGRLRAHLRQRRRRATADCLDRLRGWRNECDYLDAVPGDLQVTVTSALEEADYVFRSLVPPAS
jgi:hypothetical protein